MRARARLETPGPAETATRSGAARLVEIVELKGTFVRPAGERIMVRLEEPAGRMTSVREHVFLGAGDLYGETVRGGRDRGPQESNERDGGFSGPADPPGGFVRPDCGTTGSHCLFPPPPPLAQTLAEGLPDEPLPIAIDVPREPFALRPLERLGLYVRALRAAELRSSTEGRWLLEDVPDPRARGPEDRQIACVRLRRASVLAVLDRCQALFLDSDVEPLETGPASEKQTRIRAALGDAWGAYARSSAAAGAAVEAGGFRSFLAGASGQREAMDYVNGLRAIDRELAIMGLTPAEIRRARAAILGPITPAALSEAELEEALGLDGLG